MESIWPDSGCTSFHGGPRKPRGTPSKDSHCPCRRSNMPSPDDKSQASALNLCGVTMWNTPTVAKSKKRVKIWTSEYYHPWFFTLPFRKAEKGWSNIVSWQSKWGTPSTFRFPLPASRPMETNQQIRGSADNSTSSSRPYRG